jgi:hypothetical protein
MIKKGKVFLKKFLITSGDFPRLKNLFSNPLIIDLKPTLCNKAFIRYLSIFILLVSLMGISNFGLGQANGDYRTRVTANWNANNTWQVYNAGWVNTNNEPGSVSGAQTVTIRNTHNITLNFNPPFTIGNLVVGEGTSGTLRFERNNNYSLTVTGDVTVSAGASFTIRARSSGTPVNNLYIGGNISNNGTFTFTNNTYQSNVTLNGTSAQTIGGANSSTINNLIISNSNASGVTLAINTSITGDLTLNSNVLFDLSSYTCNRSAAGGTIAINSGATLKMGGTNTFPTNYTTHTLNTSSTVEYYGTNQTVSAETYGNLILSGSNTKTLAAAITVSNNLSISTGVIANLGTYTSSANTMTLGGEGVMNGSWGSSSSSATYKNDTYFSATSGIINITTSTCTTPQGSLTANGPFCTTGTGQLTWTATAGTGPFTVVYNDGTADRTQNNVTSGTPFDVYTNPVTSSTTYNLVSVTGKYYCSRNSGFTGGSATITINSIPSAPSTTGATICAGGTATLSASGAGAGDKYKWYDAATGGTLLKTSTDNTDNTYTTSILNTTTNYWVSILSAAGCESSRTQVIASYPYPPSGSETSAGSNSWIGHIYDGINFDNYLGSYTHTETFLDGFGTEPGYGSDDASCFAINSGGSVRILTFSVKYRMNSTKRGLYRADITSDDGTRLTVDGTMV